MSRARITKKHASGWYPSILRHDRLWEKRNRTDLFFLIGSIRGPQAPVKYSKCKICEGNSHHSPDFGWENYDSFNRRMK